MRSTPCLILAALLVGAACAPQQQASIRLIADNPAVTATPHVIFVTPTPAPTTIPTLEIVTPTPSLTPTVPPSSTPDPQQVASACREALTRLYTTAAEMCLGKPNGYVCNGGDAPQVEPAGAVANTLASAGAVVEAALVNSIRTPPRGIIYVRLANDVSMKALLIGDVEMRDNTPPGFPKWKNFIVTTYEMVSGCDEVPGSVFVLQGEYGARTSLVVNGVSVDLTGTLAVYTSGSISHFISLEGLVRMLINGTAYSLYAGQQLDVRYAEADYRQPLGIAGEPQPLSWALIENLPVVLMDRPVLLPQPGYVETTGSINMRVAPSENSQLIYQVPAGQVLDVLGRNPEGTWYHVRLGNNETGWMRSDLLLSRLGEISAVYEETPVPPQRFGALGTGAQVVAPQGGNLRVGPDTYFSTLRTLEQGTPLQLLARSPYSPWVKVRAGDSEGWLALITLETQSVIASLPVDYQAPLPPRPTSTPVFQFGGGHAYPDPRGGQ
jgi:uncharacterized protein YgiM (DUF1202 family)